MVNGQQHQQYSHDQPEPSWNAIAGLHPRTRSKRTFIHPPLADTLVEVRPDFTLLLKDALGRRGKLRRGHGFLYGSGAGALPSFFDFRQSSHVPHSPQLPVLYSTVKDGDFAYRVASLACRDADGAMRIYQYLSITNQHPVQAKTSYLYYLSTEAEHGQFYAHVNEDYIPFESRAEPWQGGMRLQQRVYDASSGCLLDEHGRAVLRYQADPACQVAYGEAAGGYSSALSFICSLAPGETKQIRIELGDTVVNGRGGDDPGKEQGVIDEAAATALAAAQWREHMLGLASIEVPEPIIQSIFDTAKVNSMQLIAQQADGSALPGQGGFNDYTVVYTWEAATYLRMLIRLGATELVEQTLRYFLGTQAGSIGPDGDIISPEGSFRAHIFWMNETGSVLGLMGNYYLATKDRAWMAANLAQVLSACQWISRERAAMKVTDADGKKVAHYGLLPKGRVHDWPDYGYFFFSNAITWQGLQLVAESLRDCGYAEADRYLAEADDYRKCILEAVQHATYAIPKEGGILWITNEVYTAPDARAAVYALDGPTCLIDNGLIAASDPRIPEIEYILRKYYAMSDLFAVKLPGMEDEVLGEMQEQAAGGPIDLYYVNSAELAWHRIWSLRGEREKALRYFYATMAYSTTLDTLHVQERFSPQLPWLSPWQPNGSGNGRIMEMVLNTLYILDGRQLHLLPSTPAAWLEVGKQVKVDGMKTVLGSLDFSVARTDVDTLEVQLSLPTGLAELLVHLPISREAAIEEAVAVKVDGQPAAWRGSLHGDRLQLSDPEQKLSFQIRLSPKQ